MKFTITLKDPDGVQDSIDALDEMESVAGLEPDEIEAVQEARKEKAREITSKWFEYGEYLTVEIDTEAKTCTVLPAKP
jgi:hypothetical protein